MFHLDIKSFPRIALKNIRVRKVVTEEKFDGEMCIISLYRRYVYKHDKTYKTKIKFSIINNKFVITEGFHSYDKRTLCCFTDKRKTFTLSLINGEVESGYYHNRLSILEFIIPRGSIYFTNKRGEIVSNRIKLWKLGL